MFITIFHIPYAPNDINAKLFLARREYRDVCDQLSELNMQEQNNDESIEDEQLEDTGM